MTHIRRLLVAFTIALACQISVGQNLLEFNAVYPIADGFSNIAVNVKPSNTSTDKTFIMQDNIEDLLTHTYIFQSTVPITSDFLYRYIVTFTNGTTIGEPFWRQLTSCRILSTDGAYTATKYEYFGQSEINVGVPPVPLFISKYVPPPAYFDDDQIMTVSFQISQEDLDAVIFNPNDKGEVYVSSNMTLVGLESRKYISKTKIRRAGGISLRSNPYSYQIKFKEQVGDEKIDVVIKFKAYPQDYQKDGADIIAEKTSADICRAVGAPINYISYVRLIINGEYQGFYGMVEKVDEEFVERRWPYKASGNLPGALYKIQSSHWYLLTSSGWQSGIREFCDQQGSKDTECCPCVNNNCEINDECDVFKEDDDVCPNFDCCACTWESNGNVELEFGTCKSQAPYTDFITLGDTVWANDPTAISSIINAESYALSLLCALTVMNADGYVYNGKNYYWYRDSVSGQFNLILYDQDTTFTASQYAHNNWTPWNWTLEGNLSDAPFLSTLLENPQVLNTYNTVAKSFVDKYYRTDSEGALYQRMMIYADFVARYNPGRREVVDETESFLNWFIDPMSSKLQTQFNAPQPPLFSVPPPVCNATLAFN